MKSLSHARLSDPMDCSLPGSSIPGIFQARVLEGVAFSTAGIWPGYPKVTLWEILPRVQLYSFTFFFFHVWKAFLQAWENKIILSNTTKVNNMSHYCGSHASQLQFQSSIDYFQYDRQKETEAHKFDKWLTLDHMVHVSIFILLHNKLSQT